MKTLLTQIYEEWQDLKTKPLQCITLVVSIITGIVVPVLGFLKVIEPTVIIVLEMILLVIIGIKYLKLKNSSVQLDNLYHDNIPMISTLSYILNARKRTRFNALEMKNVTITYNYDKVGNSARTVMQTVTWDFTAENNTSQAITRMAMMVFRSVFSHNADIEITAWDRDSGQRLHTKLADPEGTQRYVEIVFEKKGITPGTERNFQLRMRWRRPYQFREHEFILVDPRNYSLTTNNIKTVFRTDDDSFNNTQVEFLSLSPNFITYKNDDYNTAFTEIADGIYGCSREFKPAKNKIYLIKVVYQEDGQALTEECVEAEKQPV